MIIPPNGQAEKIKTALENIGWHVEDIEDALAGAITELTNVPELNDFKQAVLLEAAHQRQRWGSEHDAGKQPEDWFWLIGYLVGKALHSHKSGDKEKALHHTISSAAALANWHIAIMRPGMTMRPGIIPPEA